MHLFTTQLLKKQKLEKYIVHNLHLQSIKNMQMHVMFYSVKLRPVPQILRTLWI